MGKSVKFVLNKGAFRDQILMGAATATLLEGIASAAAPGGSEVVSDTVGPRVRSRIYGSLSEEGSAGVLSRAIGGMRI